MDDEEVYLIAKENGKNLFKAIFHEIESGATVHGVPIEADEGRFSIKKLKIKPEEWKCTTRKQADNSGPEYSTKRNGQAVDCKVKQR